MNNRALYIVVLVLVVLNVVSLSALWFKHGRQGDHTTIIVEGGRPVDAMGELLGLDDTQMDSLKTLRRRHFDNTKPLHQAIMENRKKLMDLSTADTVDSTALNAALQGLLDAQGQMELAVFGHFADIRALCRGEQKQRFDEVFDEILRMSGPKGGPGGGPPHGGPPGHHGGPSHGRP